MLKRIKLSYDGQHEVLPRYRAVVTIETKVKTYQLSIRATFYDICMMHLGECWVRQWFSEKASRWLQSKFNACLEDGIESTSIKESNSIAYYVKTGLARIDPQVSWFEHIGRQSGTIQLNGIPRFVIASMLYDTYTLSSDIEKLVGKSSIEALMDAYELSSPVLLSWSFVNSENITSCVPLEKYFRRTWLK